MTAGHAMTATTFNPLATARELEAAGVERRQAEAIAEGMREAADAAASADRGDLADFATKADLRTAIEPLATKAELAAAIAALEARLTWRLVGIAAAIVAAVKLIPGLD